MKNSFSKSIFVPTRNLGEDSQFLEDVDRELGPGWKKVANRIACFLRRSADRLDSDPGVITHYVYVPDVVIDGHKITCTRQDVFDAFSYGAPAAVEHLRALTVDLNITESFDAKREGESLP